MTKRFVDTGYWLALHNTGDRLHGRARALAVMPQGPLVTTEAVLLEVGDALAGRHSRELAIALLKDIRTESQIEVVPLSPDLFARAVQLYAERPDKEWGLTDCVSFVVMGDRGILEALAADQHFVQAGFRAILAEETS